MSIKCMHPEDTLRLNEEKDTWEFVDGRRNKIMYVSRLRLFRLILGCPTNTFLAITPKEDSDIARWKEQEVKQEVEDKFLDKDLTWTEMEQWIATCYRMNVNPLPALRLLLSSGLNIPVHYYEQGKEHLFVSKIGLTCVRKNDSVILSAHGTLNDLSQWRESLIHAAR